MQKKRKKTKESHLKDKLVGYKSIFRFSLVVLVLLVGLFGFFNEETNYLLRLAGIILFVVYIALSLIRFEDIESIEALKGIFFAGKISLLVLGVSGVIFSVVGKGKFLDVCASEIVSFIILLLMVVFFPAMLLNRKAFK